MRVVWEKNMAAINLLFSYYYFYSTASRIQHLQVNNILQLSKEELELTDERINYYVNRERLSECEFGDSDFLEELTSVYRLFLKNTSRKGKLCEFKKAVRRRWETVKVCLEILI